MSEARAGHQRNLSGGPASSAKSAKTGQKRTRRVNKRKTIRTVSGIRTLATLWIVLGHFQDTAYRHGRDETFLLVLNRGYIPVGMYIMLSGFITHYAYRNKTYASANAVLSFYFRRLGRVLFTYFASCALGLVDPLFTRHDALATKYPSQAIATVFLVQSWFELPDSEAWARDVPSQPNPAGWTISTLLLAWLLYPVLNSGMRAFNARLAKGSVRVKCGLIAGLYLIAIAPCVGLFIAQDGKIPNQQFELLYKYPPLRLAEFVMGMVFAELVDDPKVNQTFVCRHSPDAIIVVFVVFVIFGDLNNQHLDTVPELVEQPLVREDAETFLVSGLSPAMGMMLLGYSINSGEAARFSLTGALEHPILTELGGFSFAVYCFQYTLYFMVEQWQFTNARHRSVYEVPESGERVDQPAKLVAAYLMPYLLALVTFSAIWTVWFERPAAKIINGFAKRHFDAPSQPIVQEWCPPLPAPVLLKEMEQGQLGYDPTQFLKLSNSEAHLIVEVPPGKMPIKRISNGNASLASDGPSRTSRRSTFAASSQPSCTTSAPDLPSQVSVSQFSRALSAAQDFDGYDTATSAESLESYGGEDEASSGDDDLDYEYGSDTSNVEAIGEVWLPEEAKNDDPYFEEWQTFDQGLGTLESGSAGDDRTDGSLDRYATARPCHLSSAAA